MQRVAPKSFTGGSRPGPLSLHPATVLDDALDGAKMLNERSGPSLDPQTFQIQRREAIRRERHRLWARGGYLYTIKDFEPHARAGEVDFMA